MRLGKEFIFICFILLDAIIFFGMYQFSSGSGGQVFFARPVITPIPTLFIESPVKHPNISNITLLYRLRGHNGYINFELSKDIYETFSETKHTYFFNSDNEVIQTMLENNTQDYYLKPLINKIKMLSQNSDDQAKIAVSMIQHIPYDYESTRSTDWYFPYETLYLNTGVCSDKSILLAYILNELGYETVLFQFDDENHMAVGVKTSPEYDYRDSGYAFIETTQTAIITDVTEEFTSGRLLTSSPHFLKLHGGTKSLNVSEEFEDAVALNYFESIGSKQNKSLDYDNYYAWYNISEKYDLFYEIRGRIK